MNHVHALLHIALSVMIIMEVNVFNATKDYTLTSKRMNVNVNFQIVKNV